MSVRVKFKAIRLERVASQAYDPDLKTGVPTELQTVELIQVMEMDEENPPPRQTRSWKAKFDCTRWGVRNGGPASFFEPGKEYYVDFTKVE